MSVLWMRLITLRMNIDAFVLRLRVSAGAASWYVAPESHLSFAVLAGCIDTRILQAELDASCARTAYITALGCSATIDTLESCQLFTETGPRGA